MKFSLDEIRNMARVKLDPDNKLNVWVNAVYDDRIVVEEEGETYQYSYSVDDAGEMTLSGRQRVRADFVPLAELKSVEVLRVGTFKDMTGKSVTFTEADLDQIAANAAKLGSVLEAPLMVSHAEGDEGIMATLMATGAPVIAFASNIRRSGETLLADFTDIAEGAVDKIGKSIRRLSSEVYNNFTDSTGTAHGKALRRVCVVGTPAIKELAPITAAHLSFGEVTGGTAIIRLNEAAKTDPKEGNVSPEEIRKLQEENARLKAAADAEKARADAAEAATQETVSKLSEAQKAAKSQRVAALIDSLKAKGSVIPAMVDAGLVVFMESLPDTEADLVKLGEKDGKAVQATPFAFMEKFLMSLPLAVKFGEVAPGGEGQDNPEVKLADAKDFGGDVDQERLKLHNKAIAYMAEKGWDSKDGEKYAEAVAKVTGKERR